MRRSLSSRILMRVSMPRTIPRRRARQSGTRGPRQARPRRRGARRIPLLRTPRLATAVITTRLCTRDRGRRTIALSWSTLVGRNEDAEGLVLRARLRADRHRFPLGDLATFHRRYVSEMTTRVRTDTDRLLSDADFVSASRAGNRGAFDELLRRHRRKVNGVCRRVLGSPDAAPA
jgi:hypothetical protein